MRQLAWRLTGPHSLSGSIGEDKICCLYRDSNPGLYNAWFNRYTDYAIPAAILLLLTLYSAVRTMTAVFTLLQLDRDDVGLL